MTSQPKTSRPQWWLWLASFICITLNGCMLIAWPIAAAKTDYDMVPVRVRDSESFQPVVHATVATPHGQWFAEGQTIYTNEQGEARIRVARFIGSSINVSAPGYVSVSGLRDGRAGTDPIDLLLNRVRQNTTLPDSKAIEK